FCRWYRWGEQTLPQVAPMEPSYCARSLATRLKLRRMPKQASWKKSFYAWQKRAHGENRRISLKISICPMGKSDCFRYRWQVGKCNFVPVRYCWCKSIVEFEPTVDFRKIRFGKSAVHSANSSLPVRGLPAGCLHCI